MKLNDLEDVLELLCQIEGQLAIIHSDMVNNALARKIDAACRLLELSESVREYRHEVVRKISHGEFSG